MKDRELQNDFGLSPKAKERWTTAATRNRSHAIMTARRRGSYTFTPAPLPEPGQIPQENPDETPEIDNPSQEEELST